MKTTHRKETAINAAAHSETEQPRFQIYRQTRAGNYRVEFSTDSPVKAVETFLAESPAFDGGDMHIYNNHQKLVSASVKWAISRTEFGFPVMQRADAFYDDDLAKIARQICEREAMMESVHQSIRMSI
jgi:hypothetical protein